jgi:TIR domain
MFVSYAREDLAAVAELAADLQAVGHEVWFDRDLTGGQDWWNTILGRIRCCEVFVVGVSDPFLRSVACGREFDYARALRRVVLPVRVGSVEHEGLVHPELGRWQHVEWRGDKASALQLLGAVAGLDAAPPLPIPAPRPPPVPLSYLGILRAEIVGTDALDFDRQLGIAGRPACRGPEPGSDPGGAGAGRALAGTARSDDVRRP